MYVYLPLADGTFTVGFYSPAGRWIGESNHPNTDGAIKHMRFLNGAPFDDEPAPPPATPPAGPTPAVIEKKK